MSKRSYSEAIGQDEEAETTINDTNHRTSENKRRKIDSSLINDDNNQISGENDNNDDTNKDNKNANERNSDTKNIEINNESDKDKNTKIEINKEDKTEETNADTSNKNETVTNSFVYGFGSFDETNFGFGFDAYLNKKSDDNDGDKTNNENSANRNETSKTDEPFTADWGKKDDGNNKDNNAFQWDFNWKPTITTDFDFGLAWGQDKKTTKDNDNDNENENSNENENEDNYNFTSQPVAVLKGEELDSGDQQDNILCSVKAKIFRLEKISPTDDNETAHTNHKNDNKAHSDYKYREKGIGMLKVTTYYNNDKKDKKYARIICRRNEVHTLILNLPLLKETKYEKVEHCIRLTSIQINDKNDINDNNDNDHNDHNEDNVSVQTVLIKPLESSDVNVVMDAIQKAQQAL